MTNLENLKKLAESLGADASQCSTNLGALNVISAALGGSGDAEAIEDIAQAAPGAMEQNVEWGAGVISPESAVTSIVIPEGITSIGEDSFKQFTSIETVTIPASVKVIETNAFNGCTTLTAVHATDGLKRIESGAFSYCTALTSFEFPSTLEYIGAGAFSSIAITEITIPGGVKEIVPMAFGNCYAEKVTFLDGVKTIGSQSFVGSSKLKTVDIPSSCTSIGAEQGGAFVGCTALTEINIHKPQGSISGAPWGATNATVNWLG